MIKRAAANLAADYLAQAPPAIMGDERIAAFAEVTAGRMANLFELAERAVIYAAVDSLPEEVLDLLAYDFSIDWYDYSYTLETKRAVFKDAIKVKKRLGTKYAVATAIGSIYPQSEIEEWFDYEGQPSHFRVVLDLSNSREPADYEKIKEAVKFYKRLTAKLDGVYYQVRFGTVILCGCNVFKFNTPKTATSLRTGTHPAYVTHGRAAGIEFQLTGEGIAPTFTSPIAGTRPNRTTYGATGHAVVASSGAGRADRYTTPKAGTRPGVATWDAPANGCAVAAATAQAHPYTQPMAGTGVCESPTGGALGGTSLGAVADANGFVLTYPICGRKKL